MGFNIVSGGTPDEFPTGDILYENDFESGAIVNDDPNPVWGMISNLSVSAGNYFEIVDGISNNGSKSIRFSYTGRNGLGNTCGNVSRTHKTGVNGVDYFLSSTGEDLTTSGTSTTPNCAVGRYVYNTSNGYSKWQITAIENGSATNDKLVLTLIEGPIDGSTAQFNGGDSVILIRECGVDGNVAGNINRRSDSDQGVTYFDCFASSQSYGESLFRRLYLKASSGMVFPNLTQKLHYWDTELGGTWLTIVPVGGGIYKFRYDATAIGITLATGTLEFQFDTWYYVEEEFKAESGASAGDGAYRLWVFEKGDSIGSPDIEITGINLGRMPGGTTKSSFWGNNQHSNDCSGYWYIDDFKISTARIGP